MAKHTITHKKLQNDSGEESGIYLFTSGMLVFAPIKRETILAFTKKALEGGPNTMVSQMDEMLRSASPPPVVPAGGEGTHGADPDKTK